MKTDPIIAVQDVESSSRWYQSIFRLTSKHSGDEFDILVDENDRVALCLHKWGEHNHPTMQSSDGMAGNGLILYFRTKNLEDAREQLKTMEYDVESEIQVSPNSRKKEFSVKDPDGYFLTIAEFHNYEG